MSVQAASVQLHFKRQIRKTVNTAKELEAAKVFFTL
jgi:hypothetical protein